MASNIRSYLWSPNDGPFGKEFPVSEGPTPDGTSGYSYCVGMWQGGSMLEDPSHDELVGEEAEVVNNPVGHQSRTSPSQPPSKIFQSLLIPSTPRNFQPTLVTIPTSLPPSVPSSSHTSTSMIPELRPCPIQQSRASPIVTSQQLQ
ncbi:hypothetical protein O181_049676 [Austropuccinia psidii MF-1]|uniref:Uncharacterized protein n=1 Tax=Austropuccinia psidii MF-1 TaxID=1389203 RepID=A0A9Q3E0D2_9BASI|nr:hypothetical protein [Austropuccinia psidii MF-1]